MSSTRYLRIAGSWGQKNYSDPDATLTVNRRLSLLVLGAVLVVVGGASLVLLGPLFHDTYSGGYIEVQKSPEVPSDTTPVAVAESSVANSDLLLTAIREADRNGTSNVAMPTKADARVVNRSLPAESLYQGTDGEPGYYLTQGNETYLVNVYVLL